jgi:hypothetical protein
LLLRQIQRLDLIPSDHCRPRTCAEAIYATKDRTESDAMYRHLSNEQLLMLYQETRDAEAFGTLHARLQRHVKKSVTKILGPAADDRNLVEEITERSWTLLCEREKLLQGFDAGTGKASVYMDLMAMKAVELYRRECRGKRRLPIVPLGNHDPVDPRTSDAALASEVSGFESFLTAAESIYWRSRFRGDNFPAADMPFSARHWRRLASHVFTKFFKRFCSP